MEEKSSYQTTCIIVFLGIVIVSMVALFAMENKNQIDIKTIQQQMSLTYLLEEASNSLQIPFSCSQSLSGQSLDEPIILLVPGHNPIRAGASMGGIEFNQVNLVQTGRVPGFGDEYFAKVQMKVFLGKNNKVVREIPIRVKVSGNSVLDCQGVGFISVVNPKKYSVNELHTTKPQLRASFFQP